MEDLAFTEWLLLNCRVKNDFYIYTASAEIKYSWTLNKDYEQSWDGEDVKRYTTQQIYDYYKAQLK